MVASTLRENYRSYAFQLFEVSDEILLRNPLFTIIKLAGLSIGFVSFLRFGNMGTAQFKWPTKFHKGRRPDYYDHFGLAVGQTDGKNGERH
jgi:hypothetical protein